MLPTRRSYTDLKPAMSLDELRTQVTSIVRLMAEGCEAMEAEEALQQCLTCAYQAGQIEANTAHIKRLGLEP